MPADRSSFNQHNFRTAHGSLLVPYPSAEEAFRWSNSHAPTNDFSTLGLSDFFIAHRWVAHHRLDRLSLTGNTQELLSWGVGVNLERREPYDPILEASIGYAGAAAVAVMDEVAFVNERQDERMEGIEEGALSLVPRVVRKLDLSHLCFSLNFLFSYVSSQFPSMFSLLTYFQSFFSLSADHPRHSRRRRSKISILLIQETV